MSILVFSVDDNQVGGNLLMLVSVFDIDTDAGRCQLIAVKLILGGDDNSCGLDLHTYALFLNACGRRRATTRARGQLWVVFAPARVPQL